MGDRVVPDFYDGTGRIEIDASPKDRISLSGFYGHDEVRLQKEEDSGDNEDNLSTENLSLAMNYNRVHSQKIHTLFRMTFGSFLTQTPPPVDREPHTNKMRDFSTELNMNYYLSDAVNFKTGVQYRWMHVNYRSFDPVLSELWIDEKLNETAFYLQNTTYLGEKWVLENGIRLNHYSINSSSKIEPRLSLQYWVFNFLKLKAAYGKFSQNMVTIYNENDTYNPVDIWLPPESNMEPATADHLILGTSYEAPNLIVSLEGYYKKYNDLTQYNRERLYPEDPFFVQGTGSALGIDLFAQWVHDKWQVWGSYSLGKALKELPFQYPEPGIDEFAPRYDRRHNFNATVEYRPWKNFICSARYTVGSGLPFSFMIGAYERWSTFVINQPSDWPSHHPEEPLYYLTAIQSERDAFRFPWYHRLDISVRYQFSWAGFTFHPYGQILNVYDQPNVLYYDNHAQPHASIPFLPMAGLEIEF
jgi:hypothetical protein